MDVEKLTKRAIVGVMREKEFYGHVVSQFEKVFVDGDHFVQTAAVGRLPEQRLIKFFVNRNFVKQIFDDEGTDGKLRSHKRLMGLVEHEIMHVCYQHIFMKYADKIRGNVAVDLVVNQNIPEERYPSEGIMTIQRYNLPPNKPSQWYYDALKDNEKFQQDCKNGAFGLGGIFEQAQNSHKAWEDVMGDPEVAEHIKDILRKAKEATSEEGWGNVPGDIREHLEGLLKKKKPQLPWGKVLRQYCASCVESNLSYTMSKESSRFGTRPGTRKEDILDVGVVVDTSGSISNSELASFFNEIRWVWKNGAQVTIYEADTEVCAKYRFKGKFKGDVHGRGGTNLEVPLIEAEKGKHDLVIYCTDFCAPNIQRTFRFPVLWVLSNPPPISQHPASWGRKITMKSVE